MVFNKKSKQNVDSFFLLATVTPSTFSILGPPSKSTTESFFKKSYNLLKRCRKLMQANCSLFLKKIRSLILKAASKLKTYLESL